MTGAREREREREGCEVRVSATAAWLCTMVTTLPPKRQKPRNEAAEVSSRLRPVPGSSPFLLWLFVFPVPGCEFSDVGRGGGGTSGGESLPCMTPPCGVCVLSCDLTGGR